MEKRGPRVSESRPARARRPRGAREALGSVVLIFEAIVVFLGGLVIYGIADLPPGVERWWGIVAGALLALAMVVLAALVRHRWAMVAGWLAQVVIVLGGLLVPALAVVGVIFGALWGYATIKGASLDARNARLAQSPEPPNGE